MVKASELQVRDKVMTATFEMNNKLVNYSKVTQISTIYKSGKICPITNDGSIVSNGVVISCYVDFRDILPAKEKNFLGFNCNANRAVILTHSYIGKIMYGKWFWFKKSNYKNKKIHGLNDDGIPNWVVWAKNKYNIEII